MKVLVSIVTTDKNYLDKIKELKKFKVKQVALFFTLYGTKSVRYKIYKELIKTEIKNVPFVHLRDDMKLAEINYLIKTFNTKIFNIHVKAKHGFMDKQILEKYKNSIYLENDDHFSVGKEINNVSGICLDVSHLENAKFFNKKIYKETIDILNKYKCGIWHVSPIKKKAYYCIYDKKLRYDSHTFNSLSEFDYLKKYKKYLPKFVALEVENSIEEQLKAKEYIEKLLKF